MATFTPPIVNDRPPFLPDSETLRPWEKGLFKFFSPGPRYVMVFYLSDGSFVQDTATPENSNTNVPYPWDPSNPSAPYVTSTWWDVSQTPPVFHVDTTSHPVWIVSATNSPVQVSSEMEAALIAAGYGGNIS